MPMIKVRDSTLQLVRVQAGQGFSLPARHPVVQMDY
jgi:hypothetical protein